MTFVNADDFALGTGERRTAADPLVRLLRALSAGALTASGYIHAQLYIDGYRYIHVVGVLFLLQGAASFAISALLLVGAVVRASPLIDLAAAGAAAGALAGFIASRTVGVFGFTEHGFQPAPQSLISILVEITALVLLAAAFIRTLRRGIVSLRRPTV